jgi:catechol 2,3-dioxygenase-like lactoylglutathione lyase family enzyme
MSFPSQDHPMIRIHLASIHVDDQARAASFYTDVLGFDIKHDVPLGDHRWLTVVSPDDPDGTQLLLEPDDHPAANAYAAAIASDGLPALQLEVDDIAAEHRRLVDQGVTFVQDPIDTGAVWTAVFEDTCGNLVQLVTPVGA